MAARRGLFAALTVLVGMLLAATAAYGATAYGNHPPTMTLNYRGETIQTPRNAGYRWFFVEDGKWRVKERNWDYNDTDPFAGDLQYPPADEVTAGTVVRLRINHPRKPHDFAIRAYRKPEAKGTGQWVARDFRAVKRGGEKPVAWDVVFRLKDEHRPYLTVYSSWQSRGGTGMSYGAVWRTAHLETY